MTQDKAREVFPVQFFDPGKHLTAPGKDFSIRPGPADVVVPELEPELAAELEATEGTDATEEPAESADPKGSFVTESAPSSVLTTTGDVLPAEALVDAEKVPQPTSTEPSMPVSLPTMKLGSIEQPVVQAPVTTPNSGSAKPPRPATKRSASASTVQ